MLQLAIWLAEPGACACGAQGCGSALGFARVYVGDFHGVIEEAEGSLTFSTRVRVRVRVMMRKAGWRTSVRMAPQRGPRKDASWQARLATLRTKVMFLHNRTARVVSPLLSMRLTATTTSVPDREPQSSTLYEEQAGSRAAHRRTT